MTTQEPAITPRRDPVSAPEELLADVLHVLHEMTEAVSSGEDLTALVQRRSQLFNEVQSAAPGWDVAGFDADSWRAALAEAEERLAGVLGVAFERSESEVLSQRRVRSATRRYQR